ncbi:hypothetical protein BCR44DRAFT_1253048 [Catenaria anguillulae PL171]|uniref:Uncharacterized protein n=1 Tax=Catenaria anguillulae PL171 TaxID=765915 RepID=A0A1Y2HC49_9FUNG|nr:hypothetical protein BCR44DRAFT_1253048 [Catenaria anguillulae PL171]
MAMYRYPSMHPMEIISKICLTVLRSTTGRNHAIHLSDDADAGCCCRNGCGCGGRHRSDPPRACNCNRCSNSCQRRSKLGQHPSDENIDFIIQVFSSGPNGDDLSQESISRICDFFSAVTDLSDCQIKTIGSCLASADETIAVSTAAFLRATILASRWQGTDAFASSSLAIFTGR